MNLNTNVAVTGYKLLKEDLTSLNGRHQYRDTKNWQKVPGNGCYLAIIDGLLEGGIGARLFKVEGDAPTGVVAPNGVVCCSKVRFIQELKSIRLGNAGIKLYHRNGQLYGLAESWHENGQLHYRKHYCNGELLSIGRYTAKGGVREDGNNNV